MTAPANSPPDVLTERMSNDKLVEQQDGAESAAPRTDAALQDAVKNVNPYDKATSLIDFARQLERELNLIGSVETKLRRALTTAKADGMREAARICDEIGLDWMNTGEMKKVYATNYLVEAIRRAAKGGGE